MMNDFVKAEINDEQLAVLREQHRRCHEAQAAYYEARRVCPKCRQKKYSTTLSPCRMQPGKEETFRDVNHIRCGCGWEGIRHDLVAF